VSDPDEGDDDAPSAEDVRAMFARISASLRHVAVEAGVSPPDMQSNMWFQALSSLSAPG